MKHVYQENKKGAPVFVLLHGTGGDETDLIPLAQAINSNFNYLGVRGEVQENGMNRFFERVGMGQYNWDDLRNRADQLFEFIKEKSIEYDFDLSDVYLLGFSNGSNIALEMIFRHPEAFHHAILGAPLYPANLKDTFDLGHLNVLLSMGKNDPMAPVQENERLIEILKDRGASVSTHWVEGHNLDQSVVEAAKDWI